MSNRNELIQATHYAECWREHLPCARAEIGRLIQKIAVLMSGVEPDWDDLDKGTRAAIVKAAKAYRESTNRKPDQG